MSEAPSPFRTWLAATRPRTLPVSFAPVVAGAALARRDGALRPLPLALCLGFAVLAQIAANFANDYYDFVKGADTAARVGPRRAVSAGLVSPAAMLRATWLTCAAAFAVGLGLLPYGGIPLLVVGVAALLSAVLYTGGPYPLGYYGLGDVFVFIFFGPVAVCATVYVQNAHVGADSILVSTAVGLLAANILVANNYRDADTDRAAGKRTTVVRFGRGFAKVQFAAAHVLALAVPFLLVADGYALRPLELAPFVLLAAWAWSLCRRLAPTAAPRQLIGVLAQSGLYVATYAIALAAYLVVR